jgi:cytochrome c oxidase subunit IV
MDQHIVSRRTYFLVYLALLVLLGASLGVAFIDISPFIDTALAFLIATVKAALVVLFFMHVRYSDALVRLFMAAGLVWLAILIGLTLVDYLSRAGMAFN